MLQTILRKAAKLMPRGRGLRRLCPRSLSTYVVARMQDLDSPIEVNGQKMYLDPLDSLGLLVWGSYEKDVTQLIKTVLRPGDVAIDLGAHIGYYTLLFASLVGERGKVFAFEPEPSNFELLTRNIRLNGYGNITAERLAVSGLDGKIRLYLMDRTGLGHSVHTHGPKKPFIEVRSARLDNYLGAAGKRIDFIKMDIEGGEYAALRGMESLLLRNQNVKIVTEFYPAKLNQGISSAEEYLATLRRHEFLIYDLKRKSDEPARIEDLVSRYRENEATDILCSRSPVAIGSVDT